MRRPELEETGGGLAVAEDRVGLWRDRTDMRCVCLALELVDFLVLNENHLSLIKPPGCGFCHPWHPSFELLV